MSSDRELTRIVRSWLEEGVNALPDRVLDDVLAQLPVTSQRRPWWRAWRTNLMNGTFRFAAVGLAAIAVAAIGLAVYVSRPAVPAATSSPIASPPATQPAVVAPTASTAPATIQPTKGLSSDAPFVVFLRSDGQSSTPDDLWAMRADGKGAQLLLEGQGLPSVAWSQDGHRLLVNAEDASGVSHVSIAEVSDVIGPFVDTGFGTAADTACREKSREPFPCQSSAFSIAPDGEHVVFLQSCTYVLPGCGFFTILDLRTGQLTELTETLEQGRHKGGMALPAWSPDGTQIAFTQETDQSVIGAGGIPESNLYLINADGTNLHKVDLAVPRVLFPQWSPDGSRIAVMSDVWPDKGTNVRDVYTVRPDGTDLRQLTTDGLSAWPEWTLSGQIRFRTGDATQVSLTYSLMDADGSNVVDLVDLKPLVLAIDGSGYAAQGSIYVPGDPGRSLFWQPAD